MRCITSALTCLLLAAAVHADDWPQWLGPRRDGTTKEKVAPWKDTKVAWKIPVDKGFSCPVVSQGRVFVHAPNKTKEAEDVIALDAKTGKELWRDTYPRPAYGSIFGRGPRATPVVAGNRLYTFGITGILSCYECDTGKRLWQTDPYVKLNKEQPRFGVCCSPLVIGNVVLVSIGGKGCSLAAFDINKGELLWKGYDEPASTSSPVLFAGPTQKGKLPSVVFMTTLRLLAINPLDGTLNWEYPLVFQAAGASTTPLVIGDRIVTSTMTNGTTAVGMAVKDGKGVASQLWQNKDLTGYFSTGTVVAKEYLYLVTNELQPKPAVTLRCVELKTGKELWSKAGMGYYHAAVIATGDNHVLWLDDSGMLRLIQANPKEYRELAKAKVCGGTFGVPALADGRLYVRDDQELRCIEFIP